MIGFYVHHHGLGHRTRACAIARRLSAPAVGFGTLPQPDGWPGEWVRLPADWDEPIVDPTAGGVFHWTPSRHAGHRERFGRIAARLASDLTAMVVDTSVEVTLLARLFGVRTAFVAMHGDRRDRPHRAAFDAADLILAPWPASAPEPGWAPEWLARTVHTGAISRFDGAPLSAGARATGAGAAGAGSRHAVALWGAGGGTVAPAELAAAGAATPGWRWTLRTPQNPSPDLWRDLTQADVVVSHAGGNSVAEVAAARAPAVVIAQPRPFGEQLATVQALRRSECCVAIDEWPAPEDWPELLRRAGELGGQGWASWNFGTGADDAARAIERLASGATIAGRSAG